MIPKEIYDTYFNALLKGDRATCTRIVKDLLEHGIEVRALYRELFEQTLYQVGTLWETNKISVAREHLVTAITENLLNLVYPHLFTSRPATKKVVISCAANEHHQIGGKMVADIFEMYGWDSYFLGANTPVDQMMDFIQEIRPDVVGLSLSIYVNLPSLKQGIEALNADFPNLDILVGGQAFKWGEISSLNRYNNLRYMDSLDDLEKELEGES